MNPISISIIIIAAIAGASLCIMQYATDGKGFKLAREKIALLLIQKIIMEHRKGNKLPLLKVVQKQKDLAKDFELCSLSLTKEQVNMLYYFEYIFTNALYFQKHYKNTTNFDRVKFLCSMNFNLFYNPFGARNGEMPQEFVKDFLSLSAVELVEALDVIGEENRKIVRDAIMAFGNKEVENDQISTEKN